MQEMFFESHILSPELELQALDFFTEWYKQEYGIALFDGLTISEESYSPKLVQIKIPSNRYKETIQTIASILVDMVIDEQKSLKRYD